MRAATMPRSGDLGFNMTPMIDVVFLLIIFFLVAGHLAKQEALMELSLPAAQSAEQEREQPPAQLTVNVLPDGQLVAAGRSMPVAALPHLLQLKKQESGGDFEVRIRVDRQAAYRHVDPILFACAKASIWNVSFAVVRPREQP